MIRALPLYILVAGFWLFACSSASSSPFPEKYDAAIRRAAGRWWPGGPDWLWWKAQLWQESRLRPGAVSPVGAAGLAQFMPGTWQEVATALGYGLFSPHAVGPAIDAGAFYMARQHRFWSSPRPQMERHRLAQASYNAGAGNILAAQQACGMARDWPAISACLSAVTGRHSVETITYVQRIARWRILME